MEQRAEAFAPPVEAITIVGVAGSGKSLGEKLAEVLGWMFLGTGAMYRLATFIIHLKGLDLENLEHLKVLQIQMRLVGLLGNKLTFCGKVVGSEIKTPEIDAMVGDVSEHPEVRRIVTAVQRRLAAGKRIVVEGRDSAEVFPNAIYNFYFTADLIERGKRRLKEYLENDSGYKGTLGEVMSKLDERDCKDMTRKHSPLKRHDNAIPIDTTKLDRDQVVTLLLEKCQQTVMA